MYKDLDDFIEKNNLDTVYPEPVTGDVNNYKILYGNGLIKIGGIVTINATPVNDNTIEGSTYVSFDNQFTKVLGCQVTTIDFKGKSIKESSHIGDVTNDGLTIYASGSSNINSEIKVAWFVEGVM